MNNPRKPRHAIGTPYQPEQEPITMSTQDNLLAARNALALCESLLLEAYLHAPEILAHSIKTFLVSLTSDRETLASLQQLAALIPDERKNPNRHEKPEPN